MECQIRKPRGFAAVPIMDPSGRQVSIEDIKSVKKVDEQLAGEENLKAPNPPLNDRMSTSTPPTRAASQGTSTSNTSTRNTLPSGSELSRPPTAPAASDLDIYARSYVPAYQLGINMSPAIDKFSTPPTTIDYASYISKFAGSSFLQPLVVEPMPVLKAVPVSISRHTKNLSPLSYLYYFDECLLLDAVDQAQKLTDLNLYNVELTATDITQNLYSVKVPGLKDDAPRVELGDTVLLRQIIPFPQLIKHGLEWYASNEGSLNGSIAPGFSGTQIHASVWGVSRAQEIVVLRVDHLLTASRVCNIKFVVQPDNYVPFWRAIVDVNDGRPSLDANDRTTDGLKNENSWLRHMLFPEEADVAWQRTLPKGVFDRTWSDGELNYEQMKAVDSIITRNYGDVPFLISGVPGSGKTKTVVETALQLLSLQNAAPPHLLLCAPSNSAADTLALRLSHHLGPEDMFRLNGLSRTFAEVPEKLMPYTHTENNVFSLPEFKTMMRYKVVVTTCKDADMLVQARLTNRDLVKLAFNMMSAVSPGTTPEIEDILHWTALIVDEAAQATEPSVCVPLTVVAPPCYHSTAKTSEISNFPLFIMAGDQHQLGPRVSNTRTALSVSLFERLSSRPLYADHPLSRRNSGPYKKLTQDMLPILRPAFTNLTRNYRSHPAILAVPSVLFYSDTLIPSVAPAEGPVPTWPGWRAPHRWPVLFSCNTAPDEVEEILHGPRGTGLFNRAEALQALHYAKFLLQFSKQKKYPNRLKQEDIAIISPFHSQVVHLRNLFRVHALYGVNIGPLEAFQGLESRFLIICTTRSRAESRFVEQDQELGLGLIGVKRRFNVALTRAKEGLIVIGNPEVLVGTAKDESWRVFLSFCARNNCWNIENTSLEARASTQAWADRLAGRKANGSLEEDMEDVRLSGYVSRLERGLLYADKSSNEHLHNGVSKKFGEKHVTDDYYDAAMWTAGIAAEEALRGALDDE